MSPLTRIVLVVPLACAALAAAGCSETPPSNALTASGNVEATEVQVAAQVPGRLLERRVSEGARVEKGAVVAVLDTADAELALARAKADRAQADAQLRLVQAGSRVEDVLGNDAVMVLPTVPTIAPLRDADDAVFEAFRTQALQMLCIAGLAGLPQISLPLGTVDLCPIGLSLIAPPGRDRALIGLARAILES